MAMAMAQFGQLFVVHSEVGNRRLKPLSLFFPLGSPPSVFESDDPIKNRLALSTVIRVDDKVPFALELKTLARFRVD